MQTAERTLKRYIQSQHSVRRRWVSDMSFPGSYAGILDPFYTGAAGLPEENMLSSRLY